MRTRARRGVSRGSRSRRRSGRATRTSREHQRKLVELARWLAPSPEAVFGHASERGKVGGVPAESEAEADRRGCHLSLCRKRSKPSKKERSGSQQPVEEEEEVDPETGTSARQRAQRLRPCQLQDGNR